MTAVDDRPAAVTVSPSVAARRANRVKSGRALTASEQAAIVDLGLFNAYGATNVGELDSYVSTLLGIRRLEPWEERGITEAEHLRDGFYDPIPWNGGYYGELARRQQRAAAGGEQ